MQALKFGFGQSVLRKEYDPLLRGVGAPRETLHAVVLRSAPRTCALLYRRREGAGDAGRASCATETDDLGPLPCTVELPNVLDVPSYAILARNEVRHVGDAIAFVVTDTLEQAKDAAGAPR